MPALRHHNTDASPTSSNQRCAPQKSRSPTDTCWNFPDLNAYEQYKVRRWPTHLTHLSLFSEAQSTKHMSFFRRESRLGIRRDDGQF